MKKSEKRANLLEQKDSDAIWLKIQCPQCGRVFYKRKSQARPNKSGKFFCCRRCATLYLEGGNADAKNIICEFHASENAMLTVMTNPTLEVNDKGIIERRSYY